ncbi:DUF4212 domain-containing protein [Uliginosibacterium sp. sgz301328]|uniref:DUF4212 domain-containing protein n=1 Tax=Uliginosibacterium sp. sgz301328 TaxID=3243764 RepID=UPI00359DA478
MHTTLYWMRTRRLTITLLVLWFAATFTVSFFARSLNAWTFLGFPLGFYMSAQGVLIIYLIIVWGYAHRMDALDDEALEAESAADRSTHS